MRLLELVRLVVLNITANKGKVILTSLGIVVGAATIVMVLAIGRGGKAEVEQQFRNLSAGAIDISYERNAGDMGDSFAVMSSTMVAMPSINAGAGGGFRQGDSFSFGGDMNMMDRIAGNNDEKITLSKEQAEELELFVPNVSTSTISATGKTEVSGGNLEKAAQYDIAGVLAKYSVVSNLKIAAGEFITDEQSDNAERVCVLGSAVAKEIFGSVGAAYDSVLYIDGRRYVVNGILNSMGSVTSGISPDDSIFLPYETARKYVLGTATNPVITIVADNVKDVDTVIKDAQTVLARTYPQAKFTITDAGSRMQAATASADTLTMLLTAVATIVFIVGGIGIMNVLFVSVQQRTGEIGVLKAIGCTRRDILFEFLIEAAMISVIGGVIGVLVSFALLPIATAMGMRVEGSVFGCVVALLFALVTGTVFGFYPAWKASRLVPVDALREAE